MKQNRKYIMLAAVLCGIAASATGICWNAIGVFYTPVSEALGVLRGTFAMHNTVGTIATAVASLFVLKLFDRFSLRPVIITGALLAGVSTILMGFAKGMTAFYILAIIRGIGCSFYGNLIITTTIIRWFHKNHGLMISIVMGCCGVAGAVFSPLFAACIERFGWEVGFFFMGACILILAAPVLFFKFDITPEKCGIKPYGYEEKIEDNKKEAKAAQSKGKLITGMFIAMCLFATVQPLLTGLTQHFSGFAESIGSTAAVGATMVSACMVGNIGTKLVVGFISDKLGAVKASVIMTVINILSIGIIYAGGLRNSLVLLLIGAAAFGSCYAVAAVGLSLLTRHFFGTAEYGRIFPYVTFVSNLGTAFALTLIGYVYDFTGGYDYVFLGALAVHGLCLLLLAYMVLKRKGKSRSYTNN